MRRVATLTVVVGLLGAACSTGSETSTTGEVVTGGSSSTSITIPEDTVSGIVTGVIDGETVQVMIGEERTVIRLAGIRAPRDEECYAAQASLAVSEVAAGRAVAVVGDAIDSNGTPLRYLIIDDDVPVLVNVELVDLGAAAALHDHELAGDFLRVNDRAYSSGKGMWGTFVCGHPDDGVSADRPQLRIEQIRRPAAGSVEPGAVDIVNESYTEVAIGGWTMRDAANTATFTFGPSTVLAPGDVLSVPMACDPEAADGQSWCVADDMWSAGSNTLIIQDELGNVVERQVHTIEKETP